MPAGPSARVVVEQAELHVLRRFEDTQPCLEVFLRYRCGGPLARCRALGSASHRLLDGHRQVVQLRSNPDSSRPETLLVSFNPCPVAPLQDDALTLTGTKTAETRSARRWTGAMPDWGSATSLAIWASWGCAPTAWHGRPGARRR